MIRARLARVRLILVTATIQLWLERGCSLGLACASLYSVSVLTSPAQDSLPSSSTPAQVESFDLNYLETESGFFSWSIPAVRQSTAFDNEPIELRADSVRGLLRWGGEVTNEMAFIWDQQAGKLHLDLNRNRDLTDDPDGIFTSSETGAGRFQPFSKVRLSLSTPDGVRPVLMDLSLYQYGSRLYCSGSLRSLWAGKVTLNERDWQMGVALNPFRFRPGNNLLLRPWSEREESFDMNSTLPEVFDFPEKLFLNGQAYALSRHDVVDNGGMHVQLRFVRQQPALGDLKIHGEFIDRLSLLGDQYLVLLDQPPAEVKVPADHYTAWKIRLLAGDTEASRTTQGLRSRNALSVGQNGPAVLVVGGPLTNSVALSRRGRSLSLNYQLIGVDGEAYQLERQDRSHPPEFAVYHGDKQVASGKFEFG